MCNDLPGLEVLMYAGDVVAQQGRTVFRTAHGSHSKLYLGQRLLKRHSRAPVVAI